MSLFTTNRPGKIIGIGRNYKSHAIELGNEIPKKPLFFLKSTSCLLPKDEAIVIPEGERVDYEGELAVVVSKKQRKVSALDAASAIEGCLVANDVTARTLKKPGLPWGLSKSLDTFLPLSEGLVDWFDLKDTPIKTLLNGEVVQSATLDQMIFSVPELISYLSHCMTLEKGDLILTGTPEGVGPLKQDDVVSVHIEHVGSVSNPVISQKMDL